jgi:hypothetical protein
MIHIPIQIALQTLAATLSAIASARKILSPDNTLREVDALVTRRNEPLQQQVADLRQAVDKLARQVMADTDIIEQQTAALAQTKRALEETAASIIRLRSLAYVSIGLAGLCLLVVTLVALLK